MNCLQLQELLSPYYDDELSPELYATVAEHLDGCTTCAGRVEEFGRLTALSAQLHEPAPPSHLWPALERQLDATTRPSLATLSSIGRRNAGRLAAIAAILVIGVGIGLLAYRTQFNTPHDQRMANMDRYLDQFAQNPDEAGRVLSAHYKTQVVDLQEAARLVGYPMVATSRLPQGYSLDTIHVLDMECCICTQATYKRDGSDTLVIFEHGPDEPVCLGNRPMVNCRCNGKPTSIVQVDDRIAASWKTDGRYITLVGASDIEQVTEVMAYLGVSDRDH